jgi:hypothetical protein
MKIITSIVLTILMAFLILFVVCAFILAHHKEELFKDIDISDKE